MHSGMFHQKFFGLLKLFTGIYLGIQISPIYAQVVEQKNKLDVLKYGALYMGETEVSFISPTDLHNKSRQLIRLESRHCMVFYEDGLVLSVSSSGSPKTLLNWLKRENKRAKKGNYIINNGTITIEFPSDSNPKFNIIHFGEIHEKCLSLSGVNPENKKTWKNTLCLISPKP
jgi:hypothetical protein